MDCFWAEVRDATKKIGEGHLELLVTSSSQDEIGDLTRAFNNMVGNLKKTTVSHNYMNGIIHSMNDTLMVVDQNGQIISVNKALCDLLQYEESELIATLPGKFFSQKNFPGRDSDLMKLFDREALKTLSWNISPEMV